MPEGMAQSLLTAHEVTGLIREGRSLVCGVHVLLAYTHWRNPRRFASPVVVNAAGIWGNGSPKYADLVFACSGEGSLTSADQNRIQPA